MILSDNVGGGPFTKKSILLFFLKLRMMMRARAARWTLYPDIETGCAICGQALLRNSFQEENESQQNNNTKHVRQF